MAQKEKTTGEMFRPCPDNMHPQNIDYSQIDPPLGPLIRAINKTRWMHSFGSCAGAAYHLRQKGFYVLVGVKGLKGIQNFMKWLALAHYIGFNGYYNEHNLPGMACYEACIVVPNLLGGDRGTGASIGNSWFRFDIQLISQSIEGNPKGNTHGAITALSQALKKVEGRKQSEMR